MCQEVSSELFQSISYSMDQLWLEILIKSVQQQAVSGIELPGFPSEQIQATITGSSGEQTLREAFNFYREVKYYAAEMGIELRPNTRILDFGCGWGRVIRFFLKDVLADNLCGIDVDPEMIDLCKRFVRYGNYSVVNPMPPTEFSDESIDIVYAYSVFSHLSEPVHIKWVEEFSRILKPGGILVATTQARFFIELLMSLRGKEHESLWYVAMANSFLGTETTLADYDDGKFIFSATGGGPALPSSFYGEAFIPRAYIEQEWTKYLTFRHFVDDPNRLPQALIVMQKAGTYCLKTHLEKLVTVLSQKDAHIHNLESFLNEKEVTLRNIYKSRGWRTLLIYYKLRDKMLQWKHKL